MSLALYPLQVCVRKNMSFSTYKYTGYLLTCSHDIAELFFPFFRRYQYNTRVLSIRSVPAAALEETSHRIYRIKQRSRLSPETASPSKRYGSLEGKSAWQPREGTGTHAIYLHVGLKKIKNRATLRFIHKSPPFPPRLTYAWQCRPQNLA